jgi:3-keto-5-aminohexanoate cleavage enzyme
MKRRTVLQKITASGALLAAGPLTQAVIAKNRIKVADKPVILECAINGSVTRAKNPLAPGTLEEHTEEVIKCLDTGATIIHMHSNQPNEDVNLAAQPYKEIYGPVCKKHPGAILYATANFDPVVYNRERRAWPGKVQCGHQRILAEEGICNMVLFDTGVVPIGVYDKKGVPGPDSAFFWYGFWPDDVKYILQTCKDTGAGASISVFEPGWMKNVVAMAKAGTIPRGSKLNIYFASENMPLCAPPTVEAFELYMKMMEGLDLKWAVGYIGDKSVMDTPLARLALERGGSFRVGLEDWPNGTSNVEQLKRAKEIINAVGRPIVTGAEAIKYLDIPYTKTRP